MGGIYYHFLPSVDPPLTDYNIITTIGYVMVTYLFFLVQRVRESHNCLHSFGFVALCVYHIIHTCIHGSTSIA